MTNYKLRLKVPSGAEFEAEGTAEFILAEKASFLAGLAPGSARTEARPTVNAADAEDLTTGFWDKTIIDKGGLIRLRLKSPEISAAEAALILLAANRAISRKEDLSAITLSKALKSSGYEPDRLDRLLAKEIREGRATASGTKRNRTYRITQRGLEKAYTAIKRVVSD